jgi:DUF1680 family protein
MGTQRKPVQNKVPNALQPFGWGEVELLPGPLRDVFETNVRYLRSLSPDRYLWTFRKTAGLPTPDEPYGGWEDPKCELRGHSIGHYLSACARVVAQTGDAELKKNADYTVGELAKCQAAHGDGYLSAFPEEFFDRVDRFERVWAPYYTIHKIMLGIWEMHAYAGNKQALGVLVRMADYFKGRCDKLDHAAMQQMLRCEFGGMHEAILNLYAKTGERKYLALAQRFVKRAFIDPLAEGKDLLSGLHANTHIPQVAGQARAYELTGDERARRVVENFWSILTEAHCYATGGTSLDEVWGPPHRLADTMGAYNQEFCKSYNTEKLARYLLRWTGNAKYADFVERIFYNGILVSQHPETGMFIYYLPFRAGLRKEHGTPTATFTCCYGTGIQEYASLAQDIFYHAGNEFYVNVFAPAAATWQSPAGLVRVTQETEYPAVAATKLTVSADKAARFALVVRVPWWATKGVKVKVNGSAWDKAAKATPGSWLPIRRLWCDGDTVEMAMPMPLRLAPINDDPSLCAVMCGPLVLAGLVEGWPLPADWPQPVFTDDTKRLAKWIKPVPGKPLTFRTVGQLVDVTFVPIHQVVEEPYGLYWRFAAKGTPGFELYERAVAAFRRRQLLIVDSVAIGDAASEQAHGLESEASATGTHCAGRWRMAAEGGFFSYRLKVHDGGPSALAVTYWGSDAGEHIFDILVDGARAATQALQRTAPNRLFAVEYPIPPDLTRGKESVTVRFQPAPNGKVAGGVFALSVLRKETTS